jgi:oxygen-independent coproporphyrinogen-3 oxidase
VFGIYIHFPFCRKRCPFCDFAIAVRPQIPHEAYERAVLAELGARAGLYEGRRAVSLYFGGGTPGLWRPDCVGRVVAGCIERFGGLREVTVECIPGELECAHAFALAAAGVTRLSLGLEALDDAQLAVLGRPHSAAQALEAVEHARAAGLAVSADLMFARPGQLLSDWRRELSRALTLDVAHFSLYQLTLEPESSFGRAGLRTPDGADYFLHAHDEMVARGYVHYEISSYARPGHYAVHNSLYWRGGEYLGLGMSAHSFRRLPDGSGERFANTRDLSAYLADPTAPPVEHETLDPDALAGEAVWLWLRRLDEGIPRAAFARCYGVDPALRTPDAVQRLVSQGLLVVSDDAIRLTRRGMLLLDEVAARLL